MADLKSLEAFPPKRKVTDKTWDEQAKDFVKSLETLSNATWTKQNTKQNLLDSLNPSISTIPYAYALKSQFKDVKDREKAEALLNYAVVFFSSFDPVQIRYVDDHWRFLMEYCLDLFRQLSITDVSPLVNAIMRLDPTGGTFTVNHVRLVRYCLDAGRPSQALPILDKDIYALPQSQPKNLPEDALNEPSDFSNSFITANSGFAGKLRPEHILEYYLLGAHAYIGLRKYSRARLFLEYVLLSPSLGHATSAFQVEAYRKWILLGLLSEGQRFPLPPTSDQQVLKTLRTTCKPYEALAEDFERRDSFKFQAELQEGMNIWQEDGNRGLVYEVNKALFRFRVIDLQKTYAALPVSRVATLLNMQGNAVQQVLSDMIRASQLNASITPSSAGDAVLRFHVDTAPTSTTQGGDDIESQTKRIEVLVASIKDADRRLRLTTEYVTHERRTKRSGMGPDGDLAEQMDLTWDAPIAGVGDDEDGDEDIMGA